MQRVTLWTVLLLICFFSQHQENGWAAAPDCGPEAMARSISSCGFDIGCISRATNDFNARCGDGEDSGQPREGDPQPAATGGASEPESIPGGPETPSIPGVPGGFGDMLQQLGACGNNPDCYRDIQKRMAGEHDSGGGSGSVGPDTTSRIGETTILPSSWLQQYQEALVNCGADQQCHSALLFSNGQPEISAHCPKIIDPWGAICRIAALNELYIEHAIALQRLRQQGIVLGHNPLGSLAGSMGGGLTGGSGTGSDAGALPGSSTAGMVRIDVQVSAADANRILDRWQSDLEGVIPLEVRQRITAAMAVYPEEAPPGMPFLVYEETATAAGSHVEAKPTRRDYAFTLLGILLTDAGMEIGGNDGRLLIDSGFWCLIQSVRLHDEVDHFTSVGFHLNLRGEVEDGRDILAYAATLDPENADTHHNLAFSYSALGQGPEALAIQQHAVRLEPADDHIRSRLNHMLGIDDSGDPSAEGDFGEAFFRLSRIQALREYRVSLEWLQARDLARDKVFGSNPPVPGAHAYYQEQLHDIEEEYRSCRDRAPEILRGCAMGALILHPSCDDAPDQAQVDRSRHNNEAHLCQCESIYIIARADAAAAYLNGSVIDWSLYEEAWWPKLNWYATQWSEEIKRVNASYPAGSFKLPVESAYWEWRNEFSEESDEVWSQDIPEIANEWHKMKERALNLRLCKATLPPLEKAPKPERKKPPEKETSYGINLLVFELKMTMSGDIKAAFDFGFVKGGYERRAATDSHTFTAGSGSLEASYEYGKLGPGREHRLNVTMSTNFLKFVPGGDLAGQFLSIGSKHSIQWGSRSGYRSSTRVEGKTKIGFSVTRVPVVSMKN